MLSMPGDGNGVPACVMNIDGVPYRLGDGESLLWDDTYPHEVWNRSDQVRIALLLDVWRQDMPADIALLSRAILLGDQDDDPHGRDVLRRRKECASLRPRPQCRHE